MPFSSLQDVQNRLGDPAPLTPREVRELLPWMNQIGESGMRRLNAQVALQNLEAAEKFEQSSSSVKSWLIGLSVVVVILTIASIYDALVVSHLKGTARQASGAQEPQNAEAPVSSAKKTLGPWRVRFSIPGSAAVPEKRPIIRYSFAQADDAGSGYIAVTAANLSDQSYSVRCSIYGYDQNGRRISEGSDEFTIGKRETVLRKVLLLSQQSLQEQLGSVFWIEVVLEESS